MFTNIRNQNAKRTNEDLKSGYFRKFCSKKEYNGLEIWPTLALLLSASGAWLYACKPICDIKGIDDGPYASLSL